MKRLALIGLFTVCAVSLGRGVARAQVLNTQTFLTDCKNEAVNILTGLRAPNPTIMWCALIDREGRLLMINNTDKGGTPQNPMGSDAWRGSIEIAIAKAYTALAFSSNDLALDSRTIGKFARTDMGAAPLFGIGDTNPFRPPFGFGLGTDDFVGGFHHGIVTFPGGEPIYTNPSGTCVAHSGGKLIGGFGVSGDGVDQDETVAQKTVTDAGFCLTP